MFKCLTCQNTGSAEQFALIEQEGGSKTRVCASCQGIYVEQIDQQGNIVEDERPPARSALAQYAEKYPQFFDQKVEGLVCETCRHRAPADEFQENRCPLCGGSNLYRFETKLNKPNNLSEDRRTMTQRRRVPKLTEGETATAVGSAPGVDDVNARTGAESDELPDSGRSNTTAEQREALMLQTIRRLRTENNRLREGQGYLDTNDERDSGIQGYTHEDRMNEFGGTVHPDREREEDPGGDEAEFEPEGMEGSAEQEDGEHHEHFHIHRGDEEHHESLLARSVLRRLRERNRGLRESRRDTRGLTEGSRRFLHLVVRNLDSMIREEKATRQAR